MKNGAAEYDFSLFFLRCSYATIFIYIPKFQITLLCRLLLFYSFYLSWILTFHSHLLWDESEPLIWESFIIRRLILYLPTKSSYDLFREMIHNVLNYVQIWRYLLYIYVCMCVIWMLNLPAQLISNNSTIINSVCFSYIHMHTYTIHVHKCTYICINNIV